MSAPDTNIETQTRRQKVPLIGMIGAVVVIAALFVMYLIWVADAPAVPVAS